MIALRCMMGASSGGNTHKLRFNFTNNSYTPPSTSILFDYDPYGRPNFNFLITGYSPPAGGSLNFNFT